MTADTPDWVRPEIAARLVEGLAAQECRRAKDALAPLFDTDTATYPVGRLAELAVERIAELEQQLATADAAAAERIRALETELNWLGEHGAT